MADRIIRLDKAERIGGIDRHELAYVFDFSASPLPAGNGLPPFADLFTQAERDGITAGTHSAARVVVETGAAWTAGQVKAFIQTDAAQRKLVEDAKLRFSRQRDVDNAASRGTEVR